MPQIMVATGAGADARILHAAALRRAEEESCDLLVAHVIGGTEFESQPRAVRDAIKSETEWLIHTMIGLAASRIGINPSAATIQVREGNVASELVDIAQSIRPVFVMLGAPRAGDASEFTPDEWAEMLARFDDASIDVEQVATG